MSRVKKMREKWFEEHGTSYQSVVKWVNEQGVVWKDLDAEGKYRWHDLYKKKFGYN